MVTTQPQPLCAVATMLQHSILTQLNEKHYADYP